jgi:PAS domain-containing protein
MPARTQPRLQAFPSEDLAFRRFIAEAFAELLDDVASRPNGRPEAADLQRRLRARYPSAVVRGRAALADPGGEGELWYVYRFGSISPGRRWWEEPGHAWAILDGDRCFVEISTSLAEIVEVPRATILGQRVEAFANPGDASVGADFDGLWRELLDTGELHATLRFARLNGTAREIEYHVTRDGAGPARHLAVVREIEPR